MIWRLSLVLVLIMGVLSPALAQDEDDGPDPVPAARRFGEIMTAAACNPKTILCISGRLSMMDSIIDLLTHSADCDEAPVFSYCTGEAGRVVRDYLYTRQDTMVSAAPFLSAGRDPSFEDQVRAMLEVAEGPCGYSDEFCIPARLSVLAQTDRAVRDLPCKGDAACLARQARLQEQVGQVAARQLTRMFDSRGWPDMDRFGASADRQAWQLVRAAGRFPDLQKRALDLGQIAISRNASHTVDLPYVADQVAIAQRRPQTYGTQGRCEGPGLWRPLEIADRAAVDQRRQAVELQPLEFGIAAEAANCR